MTVTKNPAIEADPDELLGTDVIAAEMGVCTETVRRRIRNNELRAVKLGGEFRVRRRWVNEYIDSSLVVA
ncbi:helix-turn-helix domain-containing protein [Mycobacteroides abscessus]|uniref:DNA binding domain, excisionase family n=1 Tax=Mycobacteroides abscessus subsp. abscessus TaxID=1185650 RepID=A0AB38D2V6_9MYCO|nr:helix-turn-helix domain-containing protein [Mycobacteroides abscessus]MBE5419582.1 hypothetical protein [Mycobacteroides abscessus]MBE5455719.1 hypothetical protein [Mycobacteroides abscessus]MBN7461898.1 helix-turn-helix domain-containing protein [Mycobacteroides abscessus subsp. abscessus]MBN7555266.1 helix-turn-helix domain-containing protein [Mycobacteroides abscessus subsp. abscessus]MDM2404658.1 helix-turn-helix domain-containing protein [Mycobacteroides abscessus]